MASLHLTIALMATLLTVTEQLPCPLGTTELTTASGTQCIRYYNTTMTFCDAVKTCHLGGEEIISKPVFDAMKASTAFPGTEKWWVGLTDALNERGTSKSGWVWMKDGQVTIGADGYFPSFEPNDVYNQDCVTISTVTADKKLRDDGCMELNKFYCYSDPSTTASNPANFTFEKSQITTFNQPDPGCWIKSTNVPNIVDCTISCTTFGPDCVGFYWNWARQECIILPYFQAAVPLNFSSNWEQAQWNLFLKKI